MLTGCLVRYSLAASVSATGDLCSHLPFIRLRPCGGERTVARNDHQGALARLPVRASRTTACLAAL
jgi:hypothetical protein